MPFDPWDRERFLELWRRLFPVSYTRPIEEELGGEGLDSIAAFAAIFARVDVALNYTTQRYYLKPHSLQTGDPAAGPASAIGQVEFSRVAPVNQPMDIVAGTRLQAVYLDTRGTQRLGPTYQLIGDIALASGDLGPFLADVQASQVGFAQNADPESIQIFQALGSSEIASSTVVATDLTEVANAGTRDRLSEAHIGRFLVFDTGPNTLTLCRIVAVNAALQTAEVDRPLVAGVGDARIPEWADLGLSVVQPAALAGGRDGWLDAVGRDRNVFRIAGEGDEPYRIRICELPDTVSPNAINRIAHRILDPLGIRFALKETRDPQTWPGFVWDVDPFDIGTPFEGYVGGCEEVTAFVVCVSADNGLGDFGMTYDIGPVPVASAWDVSAAWDGASTEYLAGLGSLYDAISAAKAAGVCFRLVLDPAL